MHSVLLVSLLSLINSPPDAARDTVVVCPEAYLDTLQPWLAHRALQGHRVAYVSPERPADEIRQMIREVASEGRLQYVLLIGDSPYGDIRANNTVIPTSLVPANVNVRHGSETEIASDNWYADLDDDQVPDVAVGRISVKSVDELAEVIRKTLAFEQTLPPGLWRRRINLVAGVGGFGRIADSAIELTAKKFITYGIPPEYKTTMTYASWRSPFCPDPRLFRQAVRRRMNEGCLFWVYMGHGKRHRLDRLRSPAGHVPIFEMRDVDALSWSHTPPVAVFFSCYTAAFDLSDTCLGEAMLRHSGGPVAVIGGTRVTMPYGMAVLANELMRQYFNDRPATLGQLLLEAKRGMLTEVRESRHSHKITKATTSLAPVVAPSGQSRLLPVSSSRSLVGKLHDGSAPSNSESTDAGVSRLLLDMTARAFGSSSADLAAERLEHVLMFHLLGDPLLRLPYPRRVNVVAPSRVEPGKTITVSGTSEIDGRCLVELVCQRDRLTSRHPRRNSFELTERALRGMTQRYKSANDDRWATETVQVMNGSFRTRLKVPQPARGLCHVRVFVQGERAAAVGATNVYVGLKSRSTKRPSLQ